MYSLSVRVKIAEMVLDGVPAATVMASTGVSLRVYRESLRWAGVRVRRGQPWGSSNVVHRPRPEGTGAVSGHGRRLQPDDRLMIQTGREQGLTQAQIARGIGCDRSAVSRELKRHTLTPQRTYGPDEAVYSASVAQHRTDHDRARPKDRKLDESPVLRLVVRDMLDDGYSPEQVSIRLPIEFPEDESMRIAHETIYQALYVQGRGALRHELTVEKALRSGRTGRKPRSKLPARNNRPWLDGARLKDRDERTVAEHAERAVPGHWEGDLVVGPNNSGTITLVERASRFNLLGRLPGIRESETVIDRLSAMVETLPDAVLSSVTWDQGQEMAQHARFTVTTGCPVYFCDPHSPWQRPTNENFNGQLRWEFPNGTDFNLVSDEELARVQDMLNNRPRKILGGYTPRERLDELLTGVALTD